MNKYFNDDVLDILIKENCLLDVRLEKFEVVMENYTVNVILDFTMRPKSDFKKIRLIFIDVYEYDFSYERNFSFEVVAEYKFFKKPDGSFYLSIDPFVDGDDVINDKDNNFVRSSKIEMIVNL